MLRNGRDYELTFNILILYQFCLHNFSSTNSSHKSVLLYFGVLRELKKKCWELQVSVFCIDKNWEIGKRKERWGRDGKVFFWKRVVDGRKMETGETWNEIEWLACQILELGIL